MRGEVLPEGLQHGTHEEKACQHLLTAKWTEARDKPDLNCSMNLFTAPGNGFPIYVHGGPCSQLRMQTGPVGLLILFPR